MKLRIVSDLHLDFHGDDGHTLVREIVGGASYDVLVVAGDLSAAPGLRRAYEVLLHHSRKPVIYVPGNHDYYHSTQEVIQWMFQEMVLSAEGLFHVLDNSCVDIDGQRFVGSTLWFPYAGPVQEENSLNDFNLIQGFRSWVGKKAQASKAFLETTVRPGDVVITHHLPHSNSTPMQYRGSVLNRFFLHEVGEEVLGRPRLWVHGHTHSSADYQMGACRVVCNPFGYLRGMPTEPNPEFKVRFDVELS